MTDMEKIQQIRKIAAVGVYAISLEEESFAGVQRAMALLLASSVTMARDAGMPKHVWMAAANKFWESIQP